MNDASIRMLSERVRALLESATETTLDEATLRLLVDAVAKAVQGGESRALMHLEQDVDALYAYQDVGESAGFALGACWGMLEVLAACRRIVSDELERRLALAVVSNNIPLFNLLHDQPGITLGELASALGKTSSNLSQQMSRMKGHRLYEVSVEGRRKHLYLSPRGERLLKDAKSKRAAGQEGVAFNKWQAYKRTYGVAMTSAAVLKVPNAIDAKAPSSSRLVYYRREEMLIRGDAPSNAAEVDAQDAWLAFGRARNTAASAPGARVAGTMAMTPGRQAVPMKGRPYANVRMR